MENAKYIYLQLAEEIHNDRPRILTESENQTKVVYLDSLTDDETTLLNQFIAIINTRLNQTS